MIIVNEPLQVLGTLGAWIVLVGFAYLFYVSAKPKPIVNRKPPKKAKEARHPTATAGLLPDAQYEKNQLLTLEEKAYYRKLSDFAYDYGLTVFVKVPLFFIIRPRQRSKQFAAALSALCTSYVDFVLCDTALKVCMVIVVEATPKELERSLTQDTQLDRVLGECGVQVLHTLSITNDTRLWIESNMK